METMVTLECLNCTNSFDRRLTEHRRNQKENRRVFCSTSCETTWRNKCGELGYGNLANFGSHTKRDEYTPYRYFRHVCSRRRPKFNLSLTYLKTLWEEQKGICPLTNWQLVLPLSSAGFEQKHSPANASLDRIDNEQGYVEGNVRYIALIANLARGVWDDKILIEMAEAIVKTTAIRG